VSFAKVQEGLYLGPQSKQCVKVTVTATPASNPVKNIQEFVEHLCVLEKTKQKGSNANLIFRKACLRLLEDNGNNRNAKAKQILTWLGRLDSDKSTNQSRLDSFSAILRSWLKRESETAQCNHLRALSSGHDFEPKY
jgi:hypothetical protein